MIFFIHQTNASIGSNNLKSCQIFKKQKLLWLEKNKKESEDIISVFLKGSMFKLQYSEWCFTEECKQKVHKQQEQSSCFGSSYPFHGFLSSKLEDLLFPQL